MKILLIGSGPMSLEYLKVLDHYNFQVVVVSKSKRNFNLINEKYNNVECFCLKNLKEFKNTNDFEFAINCVSIESLYQVSKDLISLGLKKILIEKPGCLDINELEDLIELSKKNKTLLKIALNRRHFNSTIYIKNELKKLKVTSAHIDFTEWIKGIDKGKYSSKSLNKWLFSNSIHVIDLFFYLFGLPKEINNFPSESNKIPWHPSASIFIGNGEFKSKGKFSYKADWNGPGRWAIEFTDQRHKYFMSPLEEVRTMSLDNFEISKIEIPDNDDLEFKPGLKKMINDFHKNDFKYFISLDDYKKLLIVIEGMGGYKN